MFALIFGLSFLANAQDAKSINRKVTNSLILRDYLQLL